MFKISNNFINNDFKKDYLKWFESKCLPMATEIILQKHHPAATAIYNKTFCDAPEIIFFNLRQMQDYIPEVNKMLLPDNTEYSESGETFRFLKSSIWENLSKVFDYSKFSRDYRKKFLNAAHINVCPYCNRNFTTSFEHEDTGVMVYQAEIDHFLFKADYPYLGLTLLNMVPACMWCNQRAKKTKDFFVDPHIYPYEEDFDNDAFFSVDILSNDQLDIKINVQTFDDKKKAKLNNSIATFKLTELYKHNEFQAERLVNLKRILTKLYKKDISDLGFGEIGKELEKYLIFEGELGVEPMQKFNRDIWAELNKFF